MSFSASASKIFVVLMAVAQAALAIEQRIVHKDADAQEVTSESPEQSSNPDNSSPDEEEPVQKSKADTEVHAAPSLFGDRGVTTPGFARLTHLTALAFAPDDVQIRSRQCGIDAPALQLVSHWSVRVTASSDLSQAPPATCKFLNMLFGSLV